MGDEGGAAIGGSSNQGAGGARITETVAVGGLGDVAARVDRIWEGGNQAPEVSRQVVAYAWDWLQETDPNAHLQMPGSGTATSSDTRWYFANNKSDAVPNGSGDETAIRAVWAKDTAKLK